MLIPKTVFKIDQVVAKEATRYALNGIRVEREPDGGALAIATDGRQLVVARWKDADLGEYPDVGADLEPVEGFGATVPAAAWKKAGGAVPANSTRPVLNNAFVAEKIDDRGAVQLGCTDLEMVQKFEARILEGDYPKWRLTVPDDKRDETTVVVSARLLANLLKTVADIAGRGAEDCLVRLHVPEDEHSAVRIERVYGGTGDVNVEGIVMPAPLG